LIRQVLWAAEGLGVKVGEFAAVDVRVTVAVQVNVEVLVGVAV
jgi:hypothetical protein